VSTSSVAFGNTAGYDRVVPRDQASPCLSEEALAALISGQLGAGDMPGVEAHLAECADCRGLVADAAHGAGPAMSVTLRASRPLQPHEASRVLGGKYRLIHPLGRGGMATVWQAEHLTLSAVVAVKLINPDATVEAGALQRFLREARVVAALRSPHIVQVFDYGVDGETAYIVMELLEGESLAKRLSRVGQLGIGETARVVQQVARALGRAHDAGIIHRDLKPENVFVVKNDDEELIKVLDFGLAKASPGALGASALEATRTGMLLGTPYYMSPEQFDSNRPIDPRSDVWSLGVLAFKCLLGRQPFAGERLGQLILAICAYPLPVPSEQGPAPDGFDAWFARACARDPNARFDSARQAASEFVRVVHLADPSTSGASSLEPGSADPASAGSSAEPGLASVTDPAIHSDVAPGPTHRARSTRPAAARVGATVLLGLLVLSGVELFGRATDPRERTNTAPVPAAAARAHAELKLAADDNGCSTNQECIERHAGAPYTCRRSDETCISLLNEDCPRYFADKSDLGNDNAIYIGLLVPDDVNGAQGEAAVDLARSEIKLTLGGGVRTSATSPVHPLVIVDCNADLDQPLRAARHLVKEVKVAALLGGYVSSNVLSVAQEYTIPGGVLHITPSATADPISGLADRDLVYRAQLPGDIIFQVLTPFIEKVIQPAIYADGIATRGEPIKVMLIHSGDGSGVYQALSIVKSLQINGKPAAQNGVNLFRAVNLGDPHDKLNNPDPSRRYAQALSAIFEFRPHFLIFQAPDAFTPVLASAERLWPNGVPKPYVIVAAGLVAQLPGFLGTNAALRKRTFGFMGLPEGYDPAYFNQWAVALGSRSQDWVTQSIGQVYGPNLYDSLYMVAYAISTLADKEPTGLNLVPGFRRLGGPGALVRFGPTDMPRAIGELAAGKSIEYVGINGAFRYTPRGDRTGLAATACTTIDGTGKAIGSKPSGFVYDTEMKRVLSAAIDCP
jgi:serine/threonine protein kinase